MPESQQDIDALLAEVNALADEAVANIAGSEDFAPASGTQPSQSQRAEQSATAVAEPPYDSTKPISPLLKTGRIPTGVQQHSKTEHISRILKIEVPIIVQLSERTMPLSDILKLTTGSIIEFDKPADSELELKVNNKCIGSGQAVKVGENFGLRVTRTGTLRERIEAMGSA